MRRTSAALLAAACAVAVAASAVAGDTPQKAANKAAVLDFYDKAFNQKDVDGAAKHFGGRYIQHNPQVADGI